MSALVEEVVQKYESRDPFVIAEKMGITVVFEELGSIATYYNKAFHQKFIHVNQEMEGKIYAAHHVASMLYHAIVDAEYSIVYNRNKDRVELTDLEQKAEKFASELLEHRKHALQFETFEEYVETAGIGEEQKQYLHEWIMYLTKDVCVPKQTSCDILNRILYMLDEIERR